MHAAWIGDHRIWPAVVRRRAFFVLISSEFPSVAVSIANSGTDGRRQQPTHSRMAHGAPPTPTQTGTGKGGQTSTRWRPAALCTHLNTSTTAAAATWARPRPPRTPPPPRLPSRAGTWGTRTAATRPWTRTGRRCRSSGRPIGTASAGWARRRGRGRGVGGMGGSRRARMVRCCAFCGLGLGSLEELVGWADPRFFTPFCGPQRASSRRGRRRRTTRRRRGTGRTRPAAAR